MRIIREEKRGRLSCFISHIVDDEGELISERMVACPLCQVEKDSFTYFILYNDDMVPVQEVYEYLNFALRDSPIATRRKTANALRFLYCFLSISQRSILEIDEIAFGEFLYFIRGIDINPKEYSLITQRNNATVNGYMSIYRSFFNHIKADCPPLFRTHSVLINSPFGDAGSKTKGIKYANTLKKNSYIDRYVPKYISPSEFKAIYNTVTKHKDEQAKIILHLMYGYGMRLGEVLGLTIEDIEEIMVNGSLIPVLWLRNRTSDKPYQYAKGLPHISSKKQYDSKEYKATSAKIILTYDFYEKLLEFVEMVRETIETTHPDRKHLAAADLVSHNSELEENYYIFLNSCGKILSDQVWNIRLRAYMIECDLHIDQGTKVNNLSHRFRHGFAMFHAQFSEHKVNELELQRLMRHKSVLSTMVYYNPTPEDELEEKIKFQEELYEMLPELLKGVENE